jgi:hypothetical protein
VYYAAFEEYLKGKFNVSDWPRDLKNLMDNMKNHGQLRHEIIVNRHQLKTDGIITRLSDHRWLSEGDKWSQVDAFNTFVILGSELIISHPEHPTVQKQIPADKALLVSIQRGGSINNRMDD